MARKGTIKNMGKVHREMSDARQARKAAKAAPSAKEAKPAPTKRLTAEGAKRPDHVFQVFDYFKPFLVVAIESKERSQSVEDDIGPRLKKYVGELVSAMPSVQRAPASPWSHYSHTVDRPPPKMATVAAFVATSKDELATVAKRANVDAVFGFVFPASHDSCTLWVRCCNADGEAVCRFLSTLDLKTLRLKLEVQ